MARAVRRIGLGGEEKDRRLSIKRIVGVVATSSSPETSASFTVGPSVVKV